MGNSDQPSTVLITTDQKQQENVEYFGYLRSKITNGAKFTREIKSRIATARTESARIKLFSPVK